MDLSSRHFCHLPGTISLVVELTSTAHHGYPADATSEFWAHELYVTLLWVNGKRQTLSRGLSRDSIWRASQMYVRKGRLGFGAESA